MLNYHCDRLPAGAVSIGRKWRHVPASNRSCPNRVARRGIVAIFLPLKLRGRGQYDVDRAFPYVVGDDPGDHSWCPRPPAARWARSPSGLREAGIMPHSGHSPAGEIRRDARRAILLDMVFAAPGPRRLRGTAAASLRSGTEPGAERRRGPMPSGGHGILVPRVLEGPGLTAGSGGRAPQSAIWHVRTGHSHRNRAVHRGADQRSGPVRPRADHRPIQGGGRSAGHTPRRRGAGPARAGWIGGRWRELSVPVGAVGVSIPRQSRGL